MSIEREKEDHVKSKAKECTDNATEHAAEIEIKTGDMDLIKQKKKNKLTTPLDPTPYCVDSV